VSLELRLTILRDGGQISQETCSHISDAIAWMGAKRHMALTEDNAAMFVTHMAVALERVCKGVPVAPLEAILLTEIMRSQHYHEAQAIAAELEKLWGISFPDSELGFIWLHLCTLLDGERN